MAIFRKVHTSFWSDTFISDLDKDKKLFYLYILTNERTTQYGIYEISKKQISFDLGYSIDTVCKLLQYFIKLGKIRYNEQTKELAVGNWLKYNGSTSPKVKSCIDKEFAKVKDRVLIEYIYSIDTHPQEEEEQEEEQEEEREKKSESFYKIAGHLKLTFEEFAKLKQFGYTDTEIILKLEAIENSTNNKNYKSYFLTVKNWLIKDYGIRKVAQNTEPILDF
jgi:hypothetical protein